MDLVRELDRLQVLHAEMSRVRPTEGGSNSPAPPRISRELVDRNSILHPVCGGDAGEDCPICLDEMEAGSICRRLPCMHIFHKDCVDEYLMSKFPGCPVCRMSIFVDQSGHDDGSSEQAVFSQ